MNPRDQLAQQLRDEMARVRAVVTGERVDNYQLKQRQRNAAHELGRAESALNLLDSTAMQRSLENLRRIT
jgi:hypothetical protein